LVIEHLFGVVATSLYLELRDCGAERRPDCDGGVVEAGHGTVLSGRASLHIRISARRIDIATSWLVGAAAVPRSTAARTAFARGPASSLPSVARM
jgi:hypothetical protein